MSFQIPTSPSEPQVNKILSEFQIFKISIPTRRNVNPKQNCTTHLLPRNYYPATSTPLLLHHNYYPATTIPQLLPRNYYLRHFYTTTTTPLLLHHNYYPATTTPANTTPILRQYYTNTTPILHHYYTTTTPPLLHHTLGLIKILRLSTLVKTNIVKNNSIKCWCCSHRKWKQ